MKEQPPRISRADEMNGRGIVLAMPPVSAPYIISRLLEIGLTEAAGMAVGPISWQTIAGWQIAMGIRLPRWEIRLLRHLSVEYLAESGRAESENCPPPWRGEITEREKQVEVQRLLMVLG